MTPSTTIQRKRPKIRRRPARRHEDLREDRIQQVRERIASGYYDRPDVQRQLASILLKVLSV